MRIQFALLSALAALSTAAPVVQSNDEHHRLVARSSDDSSLPVERSVFSSQTIDHLDAREAKFGFGLARLLSKGASRAGSSKAVDRGGQESGDDDSKKTSKANAKGSDRPSSSAKSADPASSHASSMTASSAPAASATSSRPSSTSSPTPTPTDANQVCSKQSCSNNVCNRPTSKLKKSTKAQGSKKNPPQGAAQQLAELGALAKRFTLTVKGGVYDLVKRGSGILTSAQIAQLYNAPGGLNLGTGVRVPPSVELITVNDGYYDDFGKESFYRIVPQLSGCSVIIVASSKGVWTAHFWENYFKPGNVATWNQYVLPAIDQKTAPKEHLEGWTAINQEGTVPADAFTGPDTVMAIVTPRKGPRGKAHDTEVLKYKGQMQYPTQIGEIKNKLKTVLPHDVVDKAKLYDYHPLLLGADAKTLESTAAGKVVVSWNQDQYKIYAENSVLYQKKV